jgi:hypothetical protein
VITRKSYSFYCKELNKEKYNLLYSKAVELKDFRNKISNEVCTNITRFIEMSKFDWINQTPSNMPKTPEQKIMELEQKVLLLEKQKSLLEKQLETSDKKSIIFDMMIDLAEKEYNISIRKNSLPEQLTNTEKKKKHL